MPTGRTADEDYTHSLERLKKLETEADVMVVWECAINQELHQNKEMKKFFDSTEVSQ